MMFKNLASWGHGALTISRPCANVRRLIRRLAHLASFALLRPCPRNDASRRIGVWRVRTTSFLNIMQMLGLVLLVGGMAGCTGPEMKVEGKIGVIDPQRILNESSAGKKAKDSLSSFQKNRQALIELDEKELRRMEEDFIKQASVLSPTAKREREEQFRRRMQEYQQKVAELNREVQEKQKDVLESFRDKLETAVAKVAKRLGLQVVVDKSKGGPTLYHEEGLDISGPVIEEFNREYP
ncbi:Putative Outer membrane chaperone Skp (modular protein) [Nitrospira moscoviensis]|uniref:Putative Outer membrane chaperone Skp (Modular protein) n=1 Tax=Nitrospira moscoviensis TaxID=42253 RepID=A0A0K2GG71_NITMO|nr:Putative Outer membrane chaperone Skp (modular protein) [Nitrospira moscoviensis]